MNTSFNNELQQLQMELRMKCFIFIRKLSTLFCFLGAQNFDIIRFSTYRTACKLRFIQKKLNCKLINLISKRLDNQNLSIGIFIEDKKIYLHNIE
jgi:hypothetical protein